MEKRRESEIRKRTDEIKFLDYYHKNLKDFHKQVYHDK